MKNANAKTSVNDHQTALLLGEVAWALSRLTSDFVAGDQLSWEIAADASVGGGAQRCVLVDLAELISHEALSRHQALVNICTQGTELLVLSSPSQLDMEAIRGGAPMPPIGFLEQSISAIKAVLPFEAALMGVENAGEGRVLFRLCVGTLTVPVLDEVAPVYQHLWTAEGLGLYLGRGFYEMEHQAEASHCWMGAQASVLVKSSAAQLVKVELWIEPFVSRPQKLTFGENEYLLSGKTKVTAYRSIIPGYNPIDLVFGAKVDFTPEQRLSTDSRKFSIKVVGGKVSPL